MSWLTVIWSMCAAACWMVALLHLCVVALGHKRRVNLLVVLMAVGAGAVAMGELAIILGEDMETCRRILIIQHVWLTLLLVPMPWFVQVHFGTARRWLAWLASLMYSQATSVKLSVA